MTRFLGSLTGMVLGAALLLPAQASAQEPAEVDRGSSVGAPAQNAEDKGVPNSSSPAEPMDDKEAVRLLRLKAEQGDAEAQFHLGGLYWLGQGVPKDEKEAVRWFRRAAAQGNAKAQFNLGVASYLGEGTPKNDKEAAHWFRRAAEQGDAQAQYNLGLAYFFGRGMPKSYKEATNWFRHAAEQGDAQAQFNLGLSYAAGAGVPKDYVLAYQWFNLAAAGNNGEVAAKAARERDELASHMTPKQIGEGQRRSSQFRPHSGD